MTTRLRTKRAATPRRPRLTPQSSAEEFRAFTDRLQAGPRGPRSPFGDIGGGPVPPPVQPPGPNVIPPPVVPGGTGFGDITNTSRGGSGRGFADPAGKFAERIAQMILRVQGGERFEGPFGALSTDVQLARLMALLERVQAGGMFEIPNLTRPPGPPGPPIVDPFGGGQSFGEAGFPNPFQRGGPAIDPAPLAAVLDRVRGAFGGAGRATGNVTLPPRIARRG